MKEKKSLLVEITVTENDYLNKKHIFFSSLKNLISKCEHTLGFLVVYQTRTSLPPDDLPTEIPNLTVCLSPTFGVSIARNVGLEYAKENNYDYIIFHDAGIFYTDGFIDMANEAIHNNLDIVKGNINWTLDPLENKPRSHPTVQSYVSAIYDCYVWSYLFSIKFLKSHKFVDKVGPGDDSFINAGEDLVFIYNTFSNHWLAKIPVCKDAYANHEKRPLDDSKRLYYAEAQGVLVRWMLGGSNFSLWTLIHFFAFFGNAILSIISRRKNSFSILKLRLKGFVDPSKKRNLINEKY